MTVIKVIRPGMYTTIQDAGRYGYQKSGMPVAGAMDLFSLKVANILVGNKDDDACLETTLMGPELEFTGDAIIAVTGGNLTPKINDESINMWCTIRVSKGDVLSFGAVKSGCRSYIAVSGGMDVPIVMGSKSTYTRGKIGGVEGRILKSGDEIKIVQPGINLSVGPLSLPSKFIPEYNSQIIARVVLGPQDDHFTQEGLNTFLSSKYQITNDSDRMGYRLTGPKITHNNGPDIISDGIVMGSIQVPGHGSPIIMMADRQTVGGYTKIATIITPDINSIGQLKPGDIIKFAAIDIKKAHDIYKDYINGLEELRRYVTIQRFNMANTRVYKVKVNSKAYEVMVQEISK